MNVVAEAFTEAVQLSESDFHFYNRIFSWHPAASYPSPMLSRFTPVVSMRLRQVMTAPASEAAARM